MARKIYPDNHVLYGLKPGSYGYYAESIGNLFYWLNRAILDDRQGRLIESFMLVNFHIGLRCGGTYAEGRDGGPEMFSQSLSSPLTTDTGGSVGLLARLVKVTDPIVGQGHVASCSAALVGRQYADAIGPIRRLMCADYEAGDDPLDPRDFEVKCLQRLSEVATWLEKRGKQIYILRTLSDLPQTVLHIKFTQQISSNGPFIRTRPIKELLAVALYDPTQPTHVGHEGADILLPIHVLLSENEGDEAGKRIDVLENMYMERIRPYRENGGKALARIFVAYHCSHPDEKVGKQIVTLLRSNLGPSGFDIVDGNDMSRGRNLAQQFAEFADRSDYAVALYPKGGIDRANVAFELGYFVKRLGGLARGELNRAFLVANLDDIHIRFSDLVGHLHIPRSGGTSPEEEASLIFGHLKRALNG